MEFTGERVVPGAMGSDTLTIQQHIARYNFALKFCARKKVLDAACGTGYGMEILSFAAKEVYGVDNNWEATAYARRNFCFSQRPFSFHLANLSKDNFSSIRWEKVVDVVTSFETIEHLEDPDFFLENVKAALVVGGVFIFSIPNTNPSKFHAKIYDLPDAIRLLNDHFQKVVWFGQDDINITKCTPESTFFIGVAKKKINKF